MRSPRRPPRRAGSKTAVDILYVMAGTTAGHRRADRAMLETLHRCGVSTAAVTASFSAPRRLRWRIYASTIRIDVYESLALSWATRKARRRFSPRAIIYSVTHAALLQPPDGAQVPTAIRFDTPVQISRRGRRYALEHLVERRRFRRARILLPWGLEVVPEIDRVLPSSTAVVALPVPIEQLPVAVERERIAVAYAGSPAKKGLDLIAAAWALVAPGDYRLLITGIGRDEGLQFLADHGISPPERTEWLGLVSNDEFRSLTRRAEIYLSASRYEDYGIAQLEALADGALLVTAPSEGPFAALSIARDLSGALVAADESAEGLAGALRNAVALSGDERARYRRRAAERIAGHSAAVLEERVRFQVLPLLLDG